MSNDDAFDRAVRALRETGETSAADVTRTRTRVLETLHRGERRGRRTFWVLLPIAAVLAGGAAFAKNSDVVRHVWTGVAEAVGVRAPAEESTRPALPARGRGEHPSSRPAAEPSSEVANEVSTASPLETAARATAQREGMAPTAEMDLLQKPLAAREPAASDRALHAPSPSAPRRDRRAAPAEHAQDPASTNPPPEALQPEVPAASAVANDGEAASLQLYKNAYHLHFVEQRYAAALAAWDAYLHAAPTGRLVVEARYNRAIALVRLGRRGEAETALAPFARGEVSGGYRAREARELLDALNGSSR